MRSFLLLLIISHFIYLLNSIIFDIMKSFKKYYIIPATPEELYLALTKEATAQLWTGDKAIIDAAVDGEFSLWDGAIVGKFLELEPFKIVQEWFFGEEESSIVTFKLHEHKKGTSLEAIHNNIPEDAYEDILEGWEDVFMASLMDFYGDE